MRSTFVKPDGDMPVIKSVTPFVMGVLTFRMRGCTVTATNAVPYGGGASANVCHRLTEVISTGVDSVFLNTHWSDTLEPKVFVFE